VKIRTRKITLAFIAAVSLLSSIASAFAQIPPVPALPDSERRTSYSISASTCACNVSFMLLGDTNDFQNWIEVYLNGIRVNFNDPTFGWTITSPTGPLSTIPRPITDAVLTFTTAQTGTVQIVGARRPRRTSQFSEGRGVAARDLNQAVTDITATLREMWDKNNDMTGRGLFFAPGNTVGPMPSPTACQNAFLAFDATGLKPNCVVSANPPSGITAGNGIAFSGSNPVTIANNIAAGPGIALSGTNPLTIINTSGGGWKISNLTAANDGAFPALQMNLNADWVTFYNPSTGTLTTKGPVAGGGQIISNLACEINGAGPVAGGRDQSAAFAATNTIWFYLIQGTSGISCESSLTAPTALNGGGTTGPVLPSGYSSYAPAFPIVLVGSATLQPLVPQAGSTTYKVRGNKVIFVSTPYLCFTGCGFPGGGAAVSNWIPAVTLEWWVYIDMEAQVASGTLIGGGIIFDGTSSSANNSSYLFSLYTTAASTLPAVNNAILGPWPYPAGGIVSFLFCGAAGACLCCRGNYNSAGEYHGPCRLHLSAMKCGISFAVTLTDRRTIRPSSASAFPNAFLCDQD
jgi:hypothetical protein